MTATFKIDAILFKTLFKMTFSCTQASGYKEKQDTFSPQAAGN
jgi:hypothetical protein